jgi:hypothetical protein
MRLNPRNRPVIGHMSKLAYYFDGLGSLNDRAQTVGQAV